MRRCEDEKMFYRPPLLEEPCAQTLSGKRKGRTKNKRCFWMGRRTDEAARRCRNLLSCSLKHGFDSALHRVTGRYRARG